MTAPFDFLSFRRSFLPGATTSPAQSVSNMSNDYLQKRKQYLDATMEDFKNIQNQLHAQAQQDPTNDVRTQMDPNTPVNQQIAGMYNRTVDPPSVFGMADLMGRAKALGISNPEAIPPDQLQSIVNAQHEKQQSVVGIPQIIGGISPSATLGAVMGGVRFFEHLNEKIENIKPRWLKDITKSEQSAAAAKASFAQLDEAVRLKMSPSDEKAYNVGAGATEMAFNVIPFSLGYRLFGAMFGAPELGAAIRGAGPAVRSSLAWMATAAANEAGTETPWLPKDMSMADVQKAFQGDLVHDPAARKAASNLFFGNRAAIIAQAGLFPFAELGLRKLFGGSSAPVASQALVQVDQQGRPSIGVSPDDPWADVPYADYEVLGDNAVVRRQGGEAPNGGVGGAAPVTPNTPSGQTVGDQFLRRLGAGEEVVTDISGHSTPPQAPTPVPMEPIVPEETTHALDVPALSGPIGPFRDQFGQPIRLTTTPEDAAPRLVDLQDRRQRIVEAQDFTANQLEQILAQPHTPETAAQAAQLRQQITQYADQTFDLHRQINEVRLSAGLRENQLPTFWDLIKKNPLSPHTPTAEMVLAAGTTVQQNGKPIETYHGTAVPHLVSQGIDENKLGWNDPERNLFSPGFYSHTNPLAAGGDPFNPLAHRGYAMERADDLNFRQKALSDRITEYKAKATDILQNGGSQGELQNALAMVQDAKAQLALLPTPQPGVMRVFLNHRKTYHADELIPVDEALQILHTASQMPELKDFDFNELAAQIKNEAYMPPHGYQNGVPLNGNGMIHGTYFFDKLAALEDQSVYDPDLAQSVSRSEMLLNKARTGLVLEAAGYDGIRYTGGLRTRTGALTHAYVTFRAKNVVPVYMDDPVELEQIARNLGIQTQKREAILENPQLDKSLAPTEISDIEVMQAQALTNPGSVNVLKGITDPYAVVSNLEGAKDQGFVKDFKVLSNPQGGLDVMVSTLDEIPDSTVDEYARTGFFTNQDVVKSTTGTEAKIKAINLEERKAFVQTVKQARKGRGNWMDLSNLLPYTSGRGVVEAPDFYDRFTERQLANARERATEAGAVDYSPTLFDPLVSDNIRNDLYEQFKAEHVSDKGMQAALERYVDQRRIEDARQLAPDYAEALDSLEAEREFEESKSQMQEQAPLPDLLPAKAILRGYTLSTNVGQPGYTLHKVDSPDVIPFVTEEAAHAFLDNIDTIPDDVTPASDVPMEIGDMPNDLHAMTEGDAEDIFREAENDAPIIEQGFRDAALQLGIDLPEIISEQAAMPNVFRIKAETTTDDWPIQQSVFDKLNEMFGFTLDAAASPENAKVNRFFTKEQDGLKQSWANETVWVNPPYGRAIPAWMKKGFEESQRNGATVVFLVPARTDTNWWHDYAMKGEVYLVRGRLRFGDEKYRSPFPSAVVVFRPPPDHLASVSGISFMRTGEGKVGAGFDPSLFQKLGANLYSGELSTIAVKEGIQNAIDSVRSLGADGKVHVQVDERDNSITITDNGIGMTPDIVAKEFTDVGGSYKEEGSGASGGYGLAKVGLFSKSDMISVETTAKLPGTDQYVTTTLEGSGTDWVNGEMRMETRPAEPTNEDPALQRSATKVGKARMPTYLQFIPHSAAGLNNMTLSELQALKDANMAGYEYATPGVKEDLDTIDKWIARRQAEISPKELKIRTGTRIKLKLNDDKGELYWYSAFEHVERTIANIHHLQAQVVGTKVTNYDTRDVESMTPQGRAMSLSRGYLPPTIEQIPGGHLEIRETKRRKTGHYEYGAYIKVHTLNNGLFQFTNNTNVNGEDVPEEIQVNVVPNVGVDAPEYPFTTSREQLKSGAQDALDRYIKNLALMSQRRQTTALLEEFKNAPRIASTVNSGSEGRVYSMDKNPQMRELATRIAASDYSSKLHETLGDTYHTISNTVIREMPNLIQDAGRFGGIGLSRGFLGVNVNTTALNLRAQELGVPELDEDGKVILYNPFVSLAEVKARHPDLKDLMEYQGRPDLETVSKVAAKMASKSFATLVHEAAHQGARGHNEEFAGVLTRMIEGLLDFDFLINAKQSLTQMWFNVLSDDTFHQHHRDFNDYASSDNIFKSFAGHDVPDTGGRRELPVGSSESGGNLQPPSGSVEDAGAGWDEYSDYLRPSSESQAGVSGASAAIVRYRNAAGGGSGVVPPQTPPTGGGFFPRPDRERMVQTRKALADIADGLRGFQRTYLLPMRNSFQWLEDQLAQAGYPEWRPATHFDNIVAATDFARNEGFDLHMETNDLIAKISSQHLRSGKAWRVMEQHKPDHAYYYAKQWGISDSEYAAIRGVRRALERDIGADKIKDWIDYIGHLRNEQQSNNFARSIYDAPEGNKIGYFADYAKKRAMKFGGSPDLRWAVPEFIRSYYYGLHAAPIVKEATDFYKKVRNVEVRGETPYRPLADFFLDWAQYIETGYKPGLDVAARAVSKLFGKFTTMSESQAREFINFMMRQTYRAMLGWRAHTVIRDALQVLMAAPVVGGEYLDRAVTMLVKQGAEYDLMKARAYSHATVQKGIIKTGMQEWGELARIGDQGAVHQLTDAATTSLLDRARDAVPQQFRSISGTKLDPLWLYGKENLAVRMVMGEAAYQRFSDVWTDWVRTSHAALQAGTPETVPSLDEVIKKLNMGGYSPSIQRRVKELLAAGNPEAAAGVYMREVCNDAAMIFGNINTPPGLRGSSARLAMTLGHFAQGVYGFMDRLMRYRKGDPALFAKTLALIGGITAVTEMLRSKTGLNFRNWNMFTAPMTFSGSPAVRAGVGMYNMLSATQRDMNAGPTATPYPNTDVRFNPAKTFFQTAQIANPMEGALQNIGAANSSYNSPDPAGAMASWLLTGDRSGAAVNKLWADNLVDSLITAGQNPYREQPAHRMPGVNQFQFLQHPGTLPDQGNPPLPSAPSGGKGAQF